LQFTQANAEPKIAKEYVFANAEEKENKERKHNNMYSA